MIKFTIQGKKIMPTFLINPSTGSVDTKENWVSEISNWEKNKDGNDAQSQFDSLVEVVKDENGDWIES